MKNMIYAIALQTGKTTVNSASYGLKGLWAYMIIARATKDNDIPFESPNI
jgi:hypothetical protein